MSRQERVRWNPRGYVGPPRRLHAWRHGKEVAKRIYQVTQRFPRDERFGLVSQLRRSAVSMPSNIAEGTGRGSTADFLRFLYIARGSLNELDTQLEISGELGYLRRDDIELLEPPFLEFTKTLNGLIRSQRRET